MVEDAHFHESFIQDNIDCMVWIAVIDIKNVQFFIYFEDLSCEAFVTKRDCKFVCLKYRIARNRVLRL